MAVHISKRMEAIARLVTPGSRLCDVGCDHAYLPISLYQSGKISSAIAMDIVDGPLAAARKNIQSQGLSEVIETRKSDGLRALLPGEADAIIIAGMGGKIVLHILTEGHLQAKSARELILQPQSEIDEVRRFLYENDFVFLDEDMVLEDGKYYPMMKVRYQENAKEIRMQKMGASLLPQEADFLFGPMLLQKKHPVLHAYLLREQRITGEVLEKLHSQVMTPQIAKRIEEMEAYGRIIEEVIW